mgnify:CR=1 FL=1
MGHGVEAEKPNDASWSDASGGVSAIRSGWMPSAKRDVLPVFATVSGRILNDDRRASVAFELSGTSAR